MRRSTDRGKKKSSGGLAMAHSDPARELQGQCLAPMTKQLLIQEN